MSKRQSSNQNAELLESVEAGEWESQLTKRRRQQLADAADATFRRDARVNIRLSSRDLELLKRKALQEGLPYQTYLASLLHKAAKEPE